MTYLLPVRTRNDTVKNKVKHLNLSDYFKIICTLAFFHSAAYKVYWVVHERGH